MTARAVRLPLRIDNPPLGELARLIAAPARWHDHKLGSGGWLICREHVELPDVAAWPGIVAVARAIPAERTRLWVSLLRAHAAIRSHQDGGRADAVRVHIPLVGAGVLRIEGTPYAMQVGEAWAVDTVGRPHEATNAGDVDRVHLLVDVHPNGWLQTHVPWL